MGTIEDVGMVRVVMEKRWGRVWLRLVLLVLHDDHWHALQGSVGMMWVMDIFC